MSVLSEGLEVSDQRNKNWSPDELGYLEEKWGAVSLIAIASKLGRTPNAVKLKASRLGLGPHLMGSESISANRLLIAVVGNSAYYTLRKWIRAGLRVHRHRVLKASFLMVNIQTFWNWAEKHRREIDFSRFEEGALGLEPDWVKEKRQADKFLMGAKSPWTAQEDALLRSTTKQGGYTYTDICARLPIRSQSAIKRRIYDLYLPGPARKKAVRWTEEENERLRSGYAAGITFDQIGQELGRGGLAVRAHFEHLIMEENTDAPV